MSVDVAELFRELNVNIAEGAAQRSWLLRSPSGKTFHVEPIKAVERITAHSVRNFSFQLSSPVRPLFIGRTITPSMLEQAKSGVLDVITETPLQLVVRGMVFTPQERAQAPERRRRSGRTPWIRWAVERCLVLSSVPLRQQIIAQRLGTSQQSVSNSALRLGNLVQDTGHGLEAVDKTNLLKHWLAEYPGPEGQEFGWYSLDSIVEQTQKAARISKLLEVGALISGDVAADRLAPWKLPTRGQIYVKSPVDLEGYGFVPAPVGDASLVLCVPQDPTLWRLGSPEPFDSSSDLDLADAMIVYQDLLAGGDTDALEAAEHLAKWMTSGK